MLSSSQSNVQSPQSEKSFASIDLSNEDDETVAKKIDEIRHVFIPLKQQNDGEKMIIIIRVSIHDPYKHKIANVIKTGKMILDVAIKDNMTVSTIGAIVIFDMSNVTLGHGLQMTPRVVQRLVHSWQGCYPVKINSLNFINAPIYVNGILNLFKSFMSHKMRTKVNVYSKTSEDLFSSIPKQQLPAEYGGFAGNLQSYISEY
ncbi:Similar to pinta: Retinol-binding protein pinta (Drosophila melanogaster), partial [Cotesia congregata]